MEINNKNYKTIQTQYDEEKENQSKALNNNYQVLANERIEIEKMIREYESLNTAYNDGDIKVNSNYFIYISLLIISLLLLFLLFKFSLPNQQRGGGKFSFNNNYLITILGLFILFLIYKILL
jgi:ATP-dependent Zn protease